MPDIHIDASNVQQKIREKAEELKLKKPQLGFPAMYMDGKPQKNMGRKEISGIFPTIFDEPEERYEYVGKYWGANSVVEFIDDEGKYWVTRYGERIEKALREAGYKPATQGTHFSGAGIQPAGVYLEEFKKIFNTPFNEYERAQWAVRDGNLEQFNLAIANGVKLHDLRELYNINSPLLFQAIKPCPKDEFSARDKMVKRLLVDGEGVSTDGKTALHRAMQERSEPEYNYPAYIIPTLIQAGIDPLKRDDHGVPAFLYLSGDDSCVREKLKLISDAMLGVDGLSKKEKEILKAQFQMMDKTLIDGDDQTFDKLEKAFQNAWSWSSDFEAIRNRKSKIPTRLLDLLEPIIDTKRRAKFFEVMFNYDFGKFDTINDVVEEFAAHIVLPQYVLDYHEKLGLPVTEESLADLDKCMGGDAAKHLMKQIKPFIKEELFKGRSMDKIIGLNEAWHDARVVFPDQLKPLKACGEWHSLTGEKVHHVTDTDIYIQVLTRDEELVREGKIMKHCVGGGNYTTKCLQGDAHIFSVRREGESNPLSTIEAKWDGRTFKIIQNYSMGNGRPADNATKAAEWLKEQLESGEIKASRYLGEAEESKKLNTLSTISKVAGFIITPENIDASFAEYCNNTLRRAREYNLGTGKFDKVSRTTKLIVGNYHMKVVDENGQRVNKSCGFDELTAEKWFEASGLRERIWQKSPLNALIANRLEQQRALQESLQRQSGANVSAAEKSATDEYGKSYSIGDLFKAIGRILPFRKKETRAPLQRRKQMPLASVISADEYNSTERVSNSDLEHGGTPNNSDPDKEKKHKTDKVLRANRRKFRPYSM